MHNSFQIPRKQGNEAHEAGGVRGRGGGGMWDWWGCGGAINCLKHGKSHHDSVQGPYLKIFLTLMLYGA